MDEHLPDPVEPNVLEQGRQWGDKQLQAVEGELSVALVQLVDALGSESDAGCGLAKEVCHLVALVWSDSLFTVHNAPTGKEKN